MSCLRKYASALKHGNWIQKLCAKIESEIKAAIPLAIVGQPSEIGGAGWTGCYRKIDSPENPLENPQVQLLLHTLTFIIHTNPYIYKVRSVCVHVCAPASVWEHWKKGWKGNTSQKKISEKRAFS